jgi:tetratricopeptide (TPR) repeat protein
MHPIQPRLVGDCAIAVGDIDVTPAASHVFALLLALTLEPRELWTRRGLQQLLFATAEESQASHRLRQLLYRLRTFGVAVTEESDGLLRIANPVGDPLAALDRPGAGESPDRTSADILAHYAPRLSAPYLDWLERRRDALLRTLIARRVAELRAARERHDWSLTARIAHGLERAGALTEEVVVAAAEALAMLGQRDSAVELIDRFRLESDDELTAYPLLKRLHTRILKTRIVQRDGTLRGRQECLVFLADQWHQAVTGHGGRACAVFGPPGMGKSRVGQEFVASTRLGGGLVTSYHCDNQHRQAPLTIFSQLVRDLRNMRGSLGADPDLRSALDALASEQPTVPRTLGNVEARREELRRAIVDLMEAVTAEQSLLVVIDDAHLLDAASRAVVRSIADSTNLARVLILLLCRPRPDDFTLVSSAHRFSTYTLPPLSQADSRALVVELAGQRQLSQDEIAWTVGQAAGNAFYLHALAHNPCMGDSLPAHIRSLAQTSYLSLSPDARTVLEVCLLLDHLASPDRVASVSSLDDRTLLSALRELEEADLLRYEEGLFVGPHTIVRDALAEILPTASAAILHRRIAILLSDECANPAQARGIAWAAVSSWLAAGDPTSAVELALQVARATESFGEPEAGAVLLDQVPRALLSLETQTEALDEIIRLAEAGRCPMLLARALIERTVIAERSGEGTEAVARWTIRRIAKDASGSHTLSNQSTLRELVRNGAIGTELRIDAAARLLASADLTLNRTLADWGIAHINSFRTKHETLDPRLARAQLIFHTVFGDNTQAALLVRRLLDAFPEPSLAEPNRNVHSDAAFALLRMGQYAEATSLALRNWEYARGQNHLYAAEYFGTLAAEGFINQGDYESARYMLTELRKPEGQRRLIEEAVTPSRYAGDVFLAMQGGDFARAERLISDGERSNGVLASPRLRGVVLAHRLRIGQLRGDQTILNQTSEELKRLFDQGMDQGAQDALVEALWAEHTRVDNTQAASKLLSDYLLVRREIGRPEASLQQTTAGDPAWESFRPKLA